MLTFGKKLSGFRNSDGVEVAVIYARQGNKIVVTVDDCTEDYFDKNELLNFLEQEGVVEETDDYRLTEFRDTDGLTYQNDTFSTVTLERK